MAQDDASLGVEEIVGEKTEKLYGMGSETYDEEGVNYHKLTTDLNYKHEIIWTTATALFVLHVTGLYGLYLLVTLKLKLLTFIWGCLLGFGSAQGIILGAHRGFSHNAFKLTTFGQILIIILQTISGQNHIFWWARDHRLHHKFVDTDADPYNARRGFFFSHVGWLMTRKHPLVMEKGKIIDVSDLKANKLIMFQKKYFVPLFIFFSILVPVLVPVYGWNENWSTAFFTCFAYRYVHVLNVTWFINSLAHMYGTKPFDARITATQSYLCNFLTFGDGWHNYHHVFPWDHAMSEYGFKGGLATNCLYLLNRFGIAYDLKSASTNVIYNHTKRYGDGTITDEDFKLK